ncbi:MAG: STM3941 family protein [Lautropia sp.]
MDTSAEVTIARGNGRIQWLALSSILCVIVGFWLLRGSASPADLEAATNANAASSVAGWLSIIFGGLCAFWAIRRLRDKRPGLVIAPEGLTDRSNITSVGFIPWSDIQHVQGMITNRQPMLLVHVHDPAPYLARGSVLEQALRKANWRACGTPIVIAVHALQTRSDALQAEIRNRLERHRAARDLIAAAPDDGSGPAADAAGKPPVQPGPPAGR